MTCARCGAEYVASRPQQRYCSAPCRNQAGKNLRRKAARAAKNAILLKPRPCEKCGETFKPAKTYQRFCGYGCRLAASRAVNPTPRRRRLFCHRCGGSHTAAQCRNRGVAVKQYGTVDPVTRAYIPPPGVKVRHVQVTPYTHGEELTRLLKELGDA